MLELPKGKDREISIPTDEEIYEVPRPHSPSKDLFRKRSPQLNDLLGFRGGGNPVRSEFKIVLWSWVAASIDGLLLIAMSCLFLICFALILRLGFQMYLLKQLGTLNVLKIYLAIFAIASWLYLITTRAFLGCSIGEKICDLRLGTPMDRISNLYVFKVIVRNTLVLATGIFILPLCSIAFGRDVAGKISRLSLFSIK